MAMYYDQFGNIVQAIHPQQTQQYQAGVNGGTYYSPSDAPGQSLSAYEQPRSAEMPVTPSGYPSDRYALRQPRVPRRSDSPLSQRKKKSTTRKLVEGGLAAGLGIAASAYLKDRHTESSSRDPHGLGSGESHALRSGGSHGVRSGGSHGVSTGGPIINRVLEGALLTAESVGLAHLRKSKHRAAGGGSESESEETDPRLRRLVEGALATAGAVAMAYHDKNKPRTREHTRSNRYPRD